jgi:hypothetical protein
MSDLRVLVFGGRDFTDRRFLFKSLDHFDSLRRIGTVLHGAAPGADALAGEWAAERNRFVETFPARWDLYGRGAGPRRNQLMIDQGRPKFAVAFPGGRGTADMTRRCDAHGIKVWKPTV